jgi:hypothetical protein
MGTGTGGWILELCLEKFHPLICGNEAAARFNWIDYVLVVYSPATLNDA